MGAVAKSDVRAFSLRERVLLFCISRAVAAWIAAIGCTLKFEVMAEDGAEPAPVRTQGIYCFWHQATFCAAWYFRAYRACILISRSFDGEAIARTLGLLGFTSARGSSSRGAIGGLLVLKSTAERGSPVVFTADGPRGPIFKSKLGPVKLAQMTGHPVGCFHLEPERKWTLRSWDQFQIPKPFSRVAVSWARSVAPPAADAGDAELEQAREAVDAALERARAQALARWMGKR